MLEGVLASVLNRFLAAYVDGLNTSQLNVGIWSGDVKLKNLRLKTSALDKFRLPIDVKEGYLGDLTLSIPWSNLKGKPVRVLVENVFLLAAPKAASVEVDEEEEEARAQAAKQEKLANAELLGRNNALSRSDEDVSKNESFTSSLVTKIVDNLQITVRNIHIRYEDAISNPEHPFAAGITLAEFSAVSTDGDWNPTFIQNSAAGIHKLARLESLAVYFDTDSVSLAGHNVTEAQEKFNALIARDGHAPEHQFILKPVSGAGRLIMRRTMTSEVPKLDAQLLFDELGFALDDEQYRDLISVTDLFHFYTRQAQYRRFRPAPEELEDNRPRALLRFAGAAIINEVHEKHKVWSWAHFKQRRDERKAYVSHFKEKELATRAQNQHQAGVNPAQASGSEELAELEARLSYEDIRFYRSIARQELRKEREAARKAKGATELLSQVQSQHSGGGGGGGGGGWFGWIWGGGSSHSNGNEDGVLNDQQRKELYDAIEWDEAQTDNALDLDLPRDALQMRVTAKLQTGSFALRDQQRGADIVSLVFDSLQADVTQRFDNFDAAISLGGLKVYDGTSPNSLYPQIVRVKDDEFDLPGRQNSTGRTLQEKEEDVRRESRPDDPFFYLKFENKPLDDRADNALTLRLRSTEIIYHKGYIESIIKFFEPPESELELIGALIDVASETIEGIRRETRAGLENALENHKTIDMNVDVKAPIIIIPESVTVRKCQHMVLDAGRISVSSVLADQSALETVRSKQNKQYTKEDFRQLEELMYDRFFVKLEAAQLVMGNDLRSCLAGLSSNATDHGVHLLERINIDFTLHNCIVPNAPNLTKFMMTGHLPGLKVNFSDRKYKALMRMIEVAIPDFETDASGGSKAPQPAQAAQEANALRNPDSTAALDLSKQRRERLAGQLRRGQKEYVVDDESQRGEDEDEEDDVPGKDVFEDAEDATADKVNAHQKTFELNFTIDRLHGLIYKSNVDASKEDQLLVEARFEGFSVGVSVYPHHLDVDLALRSLDLEDKIVPNHDDRFRYLITSRTVSAPGQKPASSGQRSPGRPLVTVKYTRADPSHPEFMSKYESIDQTINVELSTINLTVTRASMLVAYDWIMTTFVPAEEAPASVPRSASTAQQIDAAARAEPDPADRKEKLRVRVKLNSIVVRLNNEGTLLATLTLSTADVAVLLRGESIRVAARLGSLSLTDNCQRDFAESSFSRLLAIDGDELADFTYETFDAKEQATYPGYDTSIWLRTGSLRFTFLEEPVRDLVHFFMRFAEMKAVYDAATLAASAQASQLSERVPRMHYDIVIKTPIVVLPRGPTSSDMLVADLGEIYAHNTFEGPDPDHSTTKIEAGIRHIRLASRLRLGAQEYRIQMIDDVNLSVDVVQSEHLHHQASAAETVPDMDITARMSDIHILLTEAQYCLLMSLVESLPRAFAAVQSEAEASPSAAKAESKAAAQVESKEESTAGGVDMLPELGTVEHRPDGVDAPARTTLNLVFAIHAIQLELFTSHATDQESLKNASLARFTITDTDLKLKMLENASLEAELALKAFTVRDTRPEKDTKFREIVPAVRHDGHQFMLSYSQSAASSLALVTVDSPKIIFSLDPMFALLNFFMAPFSGAPPPKPAPDSASAGKTDTDAGAVAVASQEAAEPSFAYRVNIVAPTIVLLATPEQSDSEAIVLSIKQVLMSQQAIMAVTVDQFGVFMCRMNRPKDTIRFLDNFNLTVSMDTRTSALRQTTSIEIDVDPLILRVAYRDIMLISSVVNKAIELSSQDVDADVSSKGPQRQDSVATSASNQSMDSRRRLSDASQNTAVAKQGPTGPQLLTSREIMKASFAGLQIIVIGDVHSLPLLDMNVSKFTLTAQDWSTELQVESFMSLYLNYYNLSRSHWEPFIDPWALRFHMISSSRADTGSSITLSSQRRLELNLTSTLIETALTSAAIMSAQADHTNAFRDAAPFKVRNRTGYKISIWAEHEDRRIKPQLHQLADGKDMPWRFDDSKAAREHVMSGPGNRLSLQIDGMPWERLKHISVDREGEFILNLRPKLEKVSHRLLFEVRLRDNVKVITFRSTFKVENHTLVPVEMTVVDARGEPTEVVRKIAPGEECPVPIEAAYHSRIRIRPDPGFDYGWSEEAVNWQDLTKRSTRTLTCAPNDANEAPFRFQCYTAYDRQDPLSRLYPRLSLKLRAPVEIENLLPYDIQYRIFDKNLNHNWSSYLRKGGISPIHVVELSHLLLLSIDVQSDVFSPSEFAIIGTDNPDDFPIEKFLTLADVDGLKLQLRLHYIKFPESGGAFRVQIYSPYIFINQTGLSFALKTKSWMGVAKLVAGQPQGAALASSKTPDPFIFSHSSNDRRNRMLLKVGGSGWSRPLSFEAIGSQTEVTIPSATKNEEVHVGLTIEDGLGKFKLSKVVKLTPRYLITNHLGESINLRELGAADFITVDPGTRSPLHFLRVGATKQITLAYPGLDNRWTAPFNIEDIGAVHLRIAKAGHHQHLVKVDVLLEGPTIFITLSHESGPWPFMLRNESDFTVTFAQATERRNEQGEVGADEAVGKRYELRPRSKMKYAWDYPALPDKLIKLMVGGREHNVNIMEIGSLLPFKFPNPEGRGTRVMALDVRADGPTQTLVLSNYSELTSNFKLTRQNSNMSRSETVSTMREGGFEAVDVDTRIISSFNIELEGVGVSIINKNVQELAYISFKGLELHYTESEVTTATNLICKWIQIDNQLFGGLFPIVLYPTVLPKDGKDLEVHPTLQASLIRLKDQSHGVMHVKYASVLLQEITAELDEDFLFALYEFSKLEGASWQHDEAKETDFIEHPRSIPEPTAVSQTQDDIYYEILHLQPIALNLSFMRTERVNADERVSSRNPMIFFFNALTMALGNVNEAPVRLNALVIENVRLSQATLVNRIVYHYSQGFLLQLYRVLGSADFLGNPVGLFNNVSSGVADIFYEPYQGLVMHGNKELGLGIARGASSFVKKTVFGVTDSVSKVTGSIGKGLAAATMDQEFQSRRRMTRFRNKPKHALYGITAGANSFFTSVASGFEGLALKPLEGAEQGGAGGFLKGVGKGLVGAITKPAVGVFDLASNVTEGMRNTTLVFDQNDIDRVRLPRFIASDGIVRPYSDREALGQTWLKNVDSGRFMKEYYVAHVDVVGRESDGVAMLTVNRILYIRTLRLKVGWDVPLSELSSISLESRGIALLLRGGLQGPFLQLPDAVTRAWFFKQLSHVVQNYNARHMGAE